MDENGYAKSGGIKYRPVLFKNIDFYIWRPCLNNPPLCSYADLKNGVYDINDLADMHELLDVKEENERRFRKVEEKMMNK